MEYLRKFNEKENEFIKVFGKSKIDYNALKKLVDDGLDVNSYEEIKCDNNNIEKTSLFEECILEKQDDKADYIEFLKFMDDNGFDFKKYANDFFSIMQFTYSNQMIDMTKYVLSKVKPSDLDEETCLSGIGTEESYQNCCTHDHKAGNNLATVYEMIEKFINNSFDPNKYYDYSKIYNQKLNKAKIHCDDVKIDQPKSFICNNFDIFIDGDRDRLCILNKYIFVNNNKILTEYKPLTQTSEVTKDNAFGHSLEDYILNEQIEDILFKDRPISSAPNTTYHTTCITIKLTNNKEIKISSDETASFMKIVLK